MAEPPGRLGDWHSAVQQQSRVSVPQQVRLDRRSGDDAGNTTCLAWPNARLGRRVNRASGLVGEDEAVRGDGRVPRQVPSQVGDQFRGDRP